MKPHNLYLTLLAANLISLSLLALAAYALHLGHSGWRWCVLAAVLCGKSIKTDGDKTETD